MLLELLSNYPLLIYCSDEDDLDKFSLDSTQVQKVCDDQYS
jgi:hypothetical protein